MPKIKGKQIANYSISQDQMNITTDSITDATSVVNAQYVNASMTELIGNLTYSEENLDMLANVATVGELACDTYVVEFPVSTMQVRLNGVDQNIGPDKTCYFSPDGGFTKREGTIAKKGDYLYWNNADFDLEVDDELDFVYMIYQPITTTDENSTITLDPINPAMNLIYTGADGTTSTFIIDGVSFIYGNVGGIFVWDIGGSNETAISDAGDSILQTVNSEDYTIWFDGYGSHKWSCKRGNFVPIVWLMVNPGFTGARTATNGIILDSNKQYVIVGNFYEYNGTTRNGLVRLNQDGTIDETFNTGLGFGQNSETAYSIIEDNNGKYVIVGYFTTYDGVSQQGLVRLNKDGSIDNTFTIGTGFNNGSNGVIKLDENNKYFITGNFTDYNGTSVNNMIRLNQDGTIDNTFSVVGTGFNSVPNNFIIDSNNKIVLVGNFYEYNGVTCNRLARLNNDGTLDSTFNGIVSDEAFDVIEDSNNKYVVAHSYSYYYDPGPVAWGRFNQDGSLDTTFNMTVNWGGSRVVQEVEDGKYILGGNLEDSGVPESSDYMKINNDGTVDTSFINDVIQYGADFVTEIIVHNDKYTFFGPMTTPKITRINKDGSDNTIYTP